MEVLGHLSSLFPISQQWLAQHKDFALGKWHCGSADLHEIVQCDEVVQ